MFNIVLCFDGNYNKVAYLFIHSLLTKVSERINIFIIHKDLESFSEYKKLLEDYKNLNKLNIYKFDEDLSNVEGIVHGHVTEATYYRMFLDKYLPTDLDYIFYVDADIICYQDPIGKLKEEIIKLKKSNYIISAKTEFNKNNENNYHFERLNLNSQKYLNAGVLCIDYKKWLASDVSKVLKKSVLENKLKLEFWDQDILNIVIDGNYTELDESLNTQVKLGKRNKDIKFKELFSERQVKNMTFIHYSGSYKPWTVRGALSKRSVIYNNAYEDLFNEKYNIINTWRVAALYHFFIDGILKFRIRNLKHPYSFLKIFFNSIIKKQ